MSEWLDRPIFFAGHRKSGTTLLLNLFDSHPQLCVFPSDSGFFYAWYPRYDAAEKSDKERIDRLVDVMSWISRAVSRGPALPARFSGPSRSSNRSRYEGIREFCRERVA